MSYEGIQTFRASSASETNGALRMDDENVQSLVMKTLHFEITEAFDASFLTQVKAKKEAENLDWTSAIDHVRVDNLVARLGDAESVVLYLLAHWNYEPQVVRFLNILLSRGASIQQLRDGVGNSPLHMAAAANYVIVSECLLNAFPEMLMTLNGAQQLPVETAIQCRKDDVASCLLRKMTSQSVRDLFHGEGSTKSKLTFIELVHNHPGEMRQTILAALDCTVIPKWTRPPSLLSNDILCGAWETLADPPTHFEVSYEALESDEFGRTPADPMYQYCTKSALYYLARYLRSSLDKELMKHPTIVLINHRKWNKYAAFWFKVRCCNYIVYLVSIVLMCAAHDGVQKVSIFWAGCMANWFLLDELSELYREPKAYWTDPFNYLDVISNAMTLITATLVYKEKNALYWYMASLTFLVNSLGIFKYSIVSSVTGSYTRVLGQVIVRDVPRFIGVFLIITASFLFSYFFAIKAHREENYPEERFLDMLKNGNFTRDTLGQSSRCGDWWFCIFLSIVFSFTQGSPFSSDADETGKLGSLIALCFGLSASLVLTNILIAQLNHSYEFVQEYSQLSARAQLLHSVALVEWQMRFRIWRPKTKHYKAKEVVTSKNMNALLADYRKSS